MSRELARRIARIEAKRAVDPVSNLSDQQIEDRISELEASLEAELGPDWRNIIQEQECVAGRMSRRAEEN